MKANSLSTGGANTMVIISGILATLLIIAVLTGRKIPLLSTPRAAVLALVVLGLAMCSQGGIGRIAATGAWLHPLSIISYVLGAVIVLIGIAALFGKQIPPLNSYYQSFVAVAVIALVKLVLTTVHRLFL